MPLLILIRHLLSQWNEENRFTGWMDIPLNENETQKARELAVQVFQLPIDKIYCSSLFRNMDTVARMFEQDKRYPVFIHLNGDKMQKWGNYIDISENDVPIFCTEKLNERYYGKLQGENKETAMEKYGKERVHLWRRSWNIAPPGGESLKDVFKRTISFYKKNIEKDLKNKKNVLIVASHNSLRAIVKYIEKISDKGILEIEIPYGGIIKYEFDEKLKLKNK